MKDQNPLLEVSWQNMPAIQPNRSSEVDTKKLLHQWTKVAKLDLDPKKPTFNLKAAFQVLGGKLSWLKYVRSVLDQSGQVALLIYYSQKPLTKVSKQILGIFHCQKALLDQSGQVAFQIFQSIKLTWPCLKQLTNVVATTCVFLHVHEQSVHHIFLKNTHKYIQLKSSFIIQNNQIRGKM